MTIPMKQLLSFLIILIIILNLLCGCISSDDPEYTNAKVDGELIIVNGYGDGYREGVRLTITHLDPEDAVIDSGDVKVKVLDENGSECSTWYQGILSQIDFNQQVSFSNMYDCVGDKDTLDKGDYITFWFKENSPGYEPTLNGYTITLYWKNSEIFSKSIDFSELDFINNEKPDLVFSMTISTNKTKYFASPETYADFTVKIINKGNVTYVIDEPSLIHQSLGIEVITPNGEKVGHTLSFDELPRPIKIYPRTPIMTYIRIGGQYWDDYEQSFAENGFYFDVQGEYSIVASYETGRALDEDIVVHTMTSNKILLTVE